MEIETPRLHFTFTKFKGSKGNCNFGNPAVVQHARPDVPHSIPAGIGFAALIDHLRVGLGAPGVGGKDVSVAFVVKCIEDDFEGIGAVTREVFLKVVDNDGVDPGIMKIRGEINRSDEHTSELK